MLGMQLRAALPGHHLSDDSRHLLEIGMGVIGTTAGLVLGLLVGSATGAYNTQRNELTQLSANVVLLDRLLAHYGPDARPARATLRNDVVTVMARLWPNDPRQSSDETPHGGRDEALFDQMEQLTPATDEQRAVKAQTLGLVTELGRTRWLMAEQHLGETVSLPLLGLLVFWFCLTFLGFGLFAPRNGTVLVTLVLCAISVSAAIFLILEMYTPFEGFVQIPSAPMRSALAKLGQ
jgi:hypothetical protein